MITAVTSALSQLLVWLGTIISALLDEGGALNPLLPLFAITIAISLVLLGSKIIRSWIWGS